MSRTGISADNIRGKIGVLQGALRNAMREAVDIEMRQRRIITVMQTATADTPEGLAAMLAGAARGQGFTPNGPTIGPVTDRPGGQLAIVTKLDAGAIEMRVGQADTGGWWVIEAHAWEQAR